MRTVSDKRFLYAVAHHLDNIFRNLRQTARVDGEELVLDGTNLFLPVSFRRFW